MAQKKTRWYHYDFWGLTIAIIFGAVSFTPSLLPREPALQGLIAGLTAVTGYLVGVILHWLFRQFTSWEPPPRIQKIAWIILICSGIIAGILMIFLVTIWKCEMHISLELLVYDRDQHPSIFILTSPSSISLTYCACVLW